MSEKRRGLGRGLGALIPDPGTGDGPRPADVFFRESPYATGRSAAPAGDATGDADSRGSDSDPSASGARPDGTGGGAQARPAAVDTPAPGSEREPDDEDSASTPGLAPVPGARFAEVELTAIRPNPRQPRTVFDEDELAELVHSIREIGVMQPVVVRPLPAEAEAPEGVKYELVMGERRWRASQAASTGTIPAIIKDTDDDDLLRDALLENLHRSQLNVLEEAAAYQQLLEDFGCTQEELARRIGRSRPQISNTLRLLKLPPLVGRRVAAGVLSAGHARALLTLPDGGAMERLAQRIVAEGLSVRTVEEIVAMGVDGGSAPRTPRRPAAGNPDLDDLAAAMADRLDTRVKISMGQRRGKMTVEFASVEDLHRILGTLGVEERS